MKKLVYLILMGLISLSSQATHKPGKKVSLKQVKYNPAERMLQMEKRASAQSSQGTRIPTQRAVQRTSSTSSTQSTLVFQDLGGSVNPFTSIGDNRNYVSVVPELNLLGLFRRGGAGDGGNTPGNKLFYDLNTKGGAEGQWQVSRGRLFNNEVYPVTATNNFGPRYPQGLLFNPPGNTDTNNVRAMIFTRVLDGSNDTWGGYGKGNQRLQAGSATTQSLWSSGDVSHFRLGSVVSTSQGAIFTIEPEETVSGSTVTFTEKVMIYRYKYNSTTQTFDSTTTFLPLANAQGDSATEVGGAEIAFGPDGLHGYAVVAAYQKDLTPNFGMYPFVSKTTDGGETWSDWTVINLNVRPTEFGNINPCKDNFRDSLFVGNFVRFTDTSIVRSTSDQPFSHPVDYTMLTFDLSVDRNNTAHILTTVYVAGFGDTLEITGPTFFRPQNGGWLVDIMMKQNEDVGRPLFIKEMAGVQGCWGDCSTDENIKELNRPMISRSADGEYLSFVWLDTDQEAHPQLTDDNNSNPDLFIRNLKINQDGTIALTQTDENLSAGTDFDGRFICSSVSPILLDKTTAFEVPTTHLALGDFTGTSADWPCTHVYTSGIEVSKSAGNYPTVIEEPCAIVISTKDQLAGTEKAKASLTVYPNPVVGSEFSLNLSNLEAGKFTLELFNSQGQLISTRQYDSAGGNVNVPVKVKSTSSGMHQLRIRTRHSTLSQKIQVQP